ncbi:hypothetical protein DXG03_000324 [Asterophora parasitica]|uniref:Exonuclease domain-containing protein n=1 Tax=Asterophora parasitica TaxID=117018 RepID=A0A9P7KHN9_9AGAR|nr:hypothetical protein DXG03_000324 [Asterophora parasitica]
MFSSLGLFATLRCPDRPLCTRPQCVFSHRTDLPLPAVLAVPVAPTKSVPAKRPVPLSPLRPTAALPLPSAEPPRKLQKLAAPQRPVAVSTSSHTNVRPLSSSRPCLISFSQTGVPILRVNAALSQVAIPVRQTMLKTLYDHFLVLYHPILPKSPTIAADHALAQEEEVYKKSSKLTYRNAVIQCCAALKRRPIPDSLSHPSVGTEAEITQRADAQKAISALRLTPTHLAPYVISIDDMIKWGYFTAVPDSPGGTEPSLEGKIAKCERCSQPFQVKAQTEALCVHHWGKPYSIKVNGEKVRLYNCCSRAVSDPEGCSRGPHVFYESKLDDLHARFPFSFLLDPPQAGKGKGQVQKRTVLDVAALDCEMVYTTGGMRVARVSVVDGEGKEVFDQLVKMDEGVEVIDYITRFSGITPATHAAAHLTLSGIRAALNAFIDTQTILIGHALDNDLKTLRIVHHRCVDTAIMFPHRAGAPYRRSLRDLVRENLGTQIQTDSTAGHSSVEDAAATLDLVRWHIINKPPPKPKPPTAAVVRPP